MAENNNNRKYASNVYDISSRKPLAKGRKGAVKKQKQKLTPRQRKRLIRFLIFCFGVVAVIFGIVFFVSQMFFKVNSITVRYADESKTAKHHYTDSEIASNSTVDKGDNLLFLDTSEVSDNLEKTLPYISEAIVKRDFPSGIVIVLKESKQVYCFCSDSGYYLVNDSGKLLEKTNGEATKKYMKVTCKGLEADVIGEKIRIGEDTESILSYLELVRKSGMKIKHINFSDIDNIKMNYDNRIVIHIGKMSHEKEGVTAWKKLQLAKKSIEAEDKANPNQEGTLNMTIAKKAYFSVKTEKPTQKAEEKEKTEG